MSRNSKKRRRQLLLQKRRRIYIHAISIAVGSSLILGGVLVTHTVRAYREAGSAPVAMELDANLGIKLYVEEFFSNNDAEEMLPIIACESGFKHFDSEGEVLMNRQGSSATGIAQILASKHPDPKIIAKYNKRNNTDLTVDDFDITTLTGNIGYALVLYKVRGTRDWECAKRL